MTSEDESKFGLERGKVFPASRARSLLNPARRLVQSPSRTVASIGAGPGARVLEVGCGPGFFSPSIVRATTGPVVLLDLQADMLRMARDRLGAQGAAGYVAGDGSMLPFATASVDVAFVATMLGEVPDPAAAVDELRRVIRPGGTLAVAETRRDSDFIAISTLRDLVEARGFSFVRRRGIPWQYVALFRGT